MSCHRRVNSYQGYSTVEAVNHNDVAKLIEGIVSSIPYLLAADVQAFIENAAVGSPPLVPGRPVGGLLLMHTLFALSTLPMAEQKLKVYIRDCLAWIGSRMGIGQATILSKVRYVAVWVTIHKLIIIVVHNNGPVSVCHGSTCDYLGWYAYIRGRIS
jgi:hypothetical protein